MILEDAILELYPDLVPHKDFVITTNLGSGVPEISQWKNSYAKPTDLQLQVAWDKVQSKPKQKSQLELMQEQIDQLILDSLMGV